MRNDAGLVDGSANMLEADDFQVKIEVARANSHCPQQPLEVWCLVATLLRRTITPRVSSAGPCSRGMIRLITSSAGSRRRSMALTQPIRSLRTRSPILANSSGQSIAGVVPLRSSKVSLAMRVRPERLFWTFRAWTLAMMPPRMTSVLSGNGCTGRRPCASQGLEQFCVSRQGMAGHIKAQRLLFFGQKLGIGHLGNLGQVHQTRGGPVGMAVGPGASSSSNSPRCPRRGRLAWPGPTG